MYNFFSNKLKLKAFKKALKELEAEGLYVNLSVNDNTVPVLPEMSRAVADLADRDLKPIKNEESTIDIKTLETSVEDQPVEESVSRPARKPITRSSETEPLTGSRLYEELFKNASSFLSGEDTTDPELIEKNTVSSVLTQQDEIIAEPSGDSKHRVFANLATKARARREQNNIIDEQTTEEVKIPAILPDLTMPEMQSEPEPEPEPNKVVVEVVADIPKPQPPKTITKTVYVTKEVPVEVPAKPKANKKPITVRKKKRKYDADISGGFNF